MFDDLAFNLLTVKSAAPINVERAMHISFWPDICTEFSIASVQASNLLYVPLNICIDVNAACNIVCSIMMDDSKEPLEGICLTFCTVCWLFSLALCIIETLLDYSHG